MSAEARLAELGIELPSPPRPVANYLPAVRVGELLFLSGHGPLLPDGTRVNGKLGADVDVERAAKRPGSPGSACWRRCARSWGR